MNFFIGVLIVVLLLSCGFLAYVRYSLARRRALDKQLKVLAEQWGLDLTIPQPTFGGLLRGFPRIYGRLGDREVSLECQQSGIEESHQVDTRLQISTQAAREFGFILERRRRLSGTTGRREGDSWTTGDEEFDAEFALWTVAPEAAAAFFDDTVRRRCRELWTSGGGRLSLREGALSFRSAGLILSEDRRKLWVQHYGLMQALAGLLDSQEVKD